MSKKKSAIKLIFALLAVGVAVTLVLGLFIKSSRTYVDMDRFGRNICQVIGAENITSTQHGFPLTFLTTYEAKCGSVPPEWQTLNLAGNVTFFSVLAFGIFYLRRKIA